MKNLGGLDGHPPLEEEKKKKIIAFIWFSIGIFKR